MRYLLDKVTASFIQQGLLKLAEERMLQDDEQKALLFFADARQNACSLYISPHTERVLQRLAQYPHFSSVIQIFLNRVDAVQPTRYYKRWARRLREYSFTPEDAAMLSLTTFCTNVEKSIIGMNALVTFDQPMINQWRLHQSEINQRYLHMRNDLPEPYVHTPPP